MMIGRRSTPYPMFKRLIVLSLAGLLLAALWWLTRPQASTPPAVIGNSSDITGFARAFEPGAFQFPRDHGPHFDYQTEWWYYTGNLTAENGDHFGYQLTFFRRGLTPGAPVQRPSDFGTNQIYFAHFAVTDVSREQHTFAERFSRGAAGLAGASSGPQGPFTVWLEDWRVEALNGDGSTVHLRARDGEQALDLVLRTVKPVVAHGDYGLSRKSETPGNASYYVGFTRMDTLGEVTANDQTIAVSGASWFDHEWSTSALGEGIIGWNWFALQLDDGREVMFYQFRQADGGIGALSAGTLVEADGSARPLRASDVQIEAQSQWRSPETKGSYPARWRILIPSAQIELNVTPWIAGQEMRVSFPYWEGAVRFTGVSRGAPVSGSGYIELTGYVSSMQGVF